jgi:hypothetical protein
MMKQAALLVALVLGCRGSAVAQIGYLMFPQFANGGSEIAGAGMSSTITLINPESTDGTAYFEVFNDNGSHATDLIDGRVLTVPAKGTREIGFSTNGPARAGWVSILLGPNTNRSMIGSLTINIPGVGSSSIQQALPGTTFMLPARHGASMNTGLAVASVCPSPAAITVTLRNSDGQTMGTFNAQLPASGHLSKFIHEIIPVANPQSYVGSVTVAATSASCSTPLIVAAFDLGSNLGEFVVLPVGRLN